MKRAFFAFSLTDGTERMEHATGHRSIGRQECGEGVLRVLHLTPDPLPRSAGVVVIDTGLVAMRFEQPLGDKIG